jgi:hypothetical protein
MLAKHVTGTFDSVKELPNVSIYCALTKWETSQIFLQTEVVSIVPKSYMRGSAAILVGLLLT